MAASRVSSYIDRRFVFTDLAPGPRDDVLRAMVRRLADAGAFPEDKASFVLRRILNPMGTTDAIEFLIGKLKQTKNNDEFFDSMNA